MSTQKDIVKLAKQAIEHFNKKGLELLLLIEKKERDKTSKSSSGSIDHKHPILHLGEIKEMEWSDRFGKYALAKDGYLTGFLNQNSRIAFLDFLDSIYKKPEINKHISYSLFESTCFNWFVKSYQKTHNVELISYLLKEFNDNCKTYMFFFPVMFLEIEEQFKVGNVNISFFTDKDFDSLNNTLGFSEKDLNQYKKNFSGQVMASITIDKCDKGKAEKRAFEACSLAIDVIKLFCITVQQPQIATDFDIEFRVKLNPSMTTLSIQLEEQGGIFKPINLFSNIHQNPNHFHLSKIYYEKMKQEGFDLLSYFITNPSKNEIGSLVLQAIQLYAYCTSTSNTNRRVVDLFTIVESFLLRSDTEPIISTINKYFPKIVSIDYSDRIKVKEIITKMYAVRSSTIHHAKSNDINMEELSILQEAIRILILNFIKLSTKHETKVSLLNEIDLAMDKAYRVE